MNIVIHLIAMVGGNTITVHCSRSIMSKRLTTFFNIENKRRTKQLIFPFFII